MHRSTTSQTRIGPECLLINENMLEGSGGLVLRPLTGRNPRREQKGTEKSRICTARGLLKGIVKP